MRVTDGNGGIRDVTNRTLSPPEIMAAIMPMVPDAIKRLPQQPSVAFSYDCAGVGPFSVVIRREGEQLWVSIDPGTATPEAAAPSPPTAPLKAEPEPVIETTSVNATVAANAGLVERQPEPVQDDTVVEIVMVEEKASTPPQAAAPARARVGAPPIDRLFHMMFAAKASDLHLSVGMKPLVRKDGEIKVLDDSAPAFDPESMWEMLDPIMPERNREEFERRHDTDFAYDIPGLARFRSNIFMDRKGPGAVFRVIPSKIMTAEDLGLSPHILKLCHLNKGLVLVTGPTGSGKSTTLCAMVDYINRNRADHIITIEDPIEFVHENKTCLMNQREVHVHTDGFKDALRAALREDPDIILVGEMRDLETVAIAIETAETGHLVFGTLHTSSAPSTVDRIIDQFPADRQGQIRVMLAESLKGVISQTLCKKIGGGRVPVLEVLIGIPSVSNLIREAKIFQIPSTQQTAKGEGMTMLSEILADYVKKGIIEAMEGYMKAVDKKGFMQALDQLKFNTKPLLDSIAHPEH